MFTNRRYTTRGVVGEIHWALQMKMWAMIDDLRESGFEMDYLQVFRLDLEDDNQRITHSQEQPPYERTMTLTGALFTDYPDESQLGPVTQKIFVIDDGDHSTMLLAEEY